jgi:hypothetical protein
VVAAEVEALVDLEEQAEVELEQAIHQIAQQTVQQSQEAVVVGVVVELHIHHLEQADLE